MKNKRTPPQTATAKGSPPRSAILGRENSFPGASGQKMPQIDADALSGLFLGLGLTRYEKVQHMRRVRAEMRRLRERYAALWGD